MQLGTFAAYYHLQSSNKHHHTSNHITLSKRRGGIVVLICVYYIPEGGISEDVAPGAHDHSQWDSHSPRPGGGKGHPHPEWDHRMLIVHL